MKRIPSFTVLLLMTVAALLGIVSIPMLNVQYTPQAAGREISVSWNWSGASARAMEAEVTSRIEGMLATVGNVQDISSESYSGAGQVSMTFAKGTDMAAARFEVASKIRNIYSSLPDGVTYPSISLDVRGGRSQAVINYVIKSPLPSQEIARFVEDNLTVPLSSVDGVDNVSFWGATPFELEIVFDQQKAASAGVEARDIAEAFMNAHSVSVAGLAEVGDGTYSVKLKMMDRGGIGQIPVRNASGRIVRLADVASWSYREAAPESYYRMNGLNTMTLSVSASPQVNMLRVTAAVRERMAMLEEHFPDEISATLSYDASEYVSGELDKIYFRTGLCLLILLVFVFVVSRSWRYLLIVSSTLAVNILVALVLYNVFRLPIHIYTLAGITVSLGIIIDTSIVMADHYSYYRDRSVFMALLGATATTIGALCIVALLPEEDKANLMDFSKVIIINLAVSLLTAYFFIPSLLDRFPVRRDDRARSVRALRRTVRWNRFYASYIRFARRRWWAYVLVMAAMCVPSFLMFNKAVNRSNFYREPEQPVLYIRAGMPEGCTVAQLNDVVREMENYLSGFPQVSRFITNIRSAEDATISVWFRPEFERTAFPVTLKSQVTSMAINFGGANWTVSGLDNNYFNNFIVSNRRNSTIELSGYNYDRLLEYADVLINRLSANRRVSSPEIVTRSGYLAENEFHVDWDFAAMAVRNVSPYEYYNSLSSRLYDSRLGSVDYGGVHVPAVLRSSAAEAFDLWHVDNAQTELDSLKMKLSEMGSVVKKRSGLSIARHNQSYILNVGYDFIGSYELQNRVMEEAVDYMNSEVLPLGFKAKAPSRSLWSRESKMKHAGLILLVILIIYVICSMIFESLRLPLSVILMIPVSFVGVFLAFGLFGFPFDQGGFAAFVMLSGIVVNAGIYLVNAFQRDTRGTDNVRRYVKAYNHKITPVMLTVLSTVLGLVPFLFDGPSEVFWFAFAVGTIGGMVFSMLAIVVFFPVFAIASRGTAGR